MSASNPSRVQLRHRGKPVPNVFYRERADGSRAYEFLGRLDGKVRRVALDASSPTEAVQAAESLRSGVREKRVVVAHDRRRKLREVAPEYVAHLEGLAGTRSEKSPRSLEDIRTKLTLYVLPELGHLPVSAVSEQNIRDLAKSAKGMSRSTVRNILSTASGLFAWATRERLAPTNPVARARELFGEELLPDSPVKEIRALTDDEIAAAMEHVSDTFLPVIQVASETGLRISEVIGLTYARVNLEAETVEVAQQLNTDGSVRAHTKTKTTRVVPISAKAASVIREHKAQQAELGYRTDDAALIFQTATGKPQSRRNALRCWQKALEAVGIEGAGLHSLRHSFVSRLAERDVAPVFAQALAGHARIETTQNVYTRVRGSRDERVEKLREVLA